ncbi:MAG TPA: hypothetical protein VGR28_15160 [Candidatus Thermoplasmatota archaeon]|jgi:hypothetical protein|nr:hypothetical protein [Candidatus Thermoplasmatota archaeon]
MRKILMLTAVAATMVVPSIAAAVHGSPYTATGLAVGVDGGVYAAEVSWTGWWTQSFVVTLRDTVTNVAVVDHHTFRGSETWQGPVYYGTEFFMYHGVSLDASVDFDLRGWQFIQIATGNLWMGYIGSYQGYTLELVVPY